MTPANKSGWGIGSTGQLWPMLRQGEAIEVGGQPVQVTRFSALEPALGAEGTTRGISPSGTSMVLKAQLSDRSQGLVKIAIP